MKIAHSLKEQFMFQKTVMLRRWGFEVKHENLALNELINVKLLPQKHYEADFSSFSNLRSLWRRAIKSWRHPLCNFLTLISLLYTNLCSSTDWSTKFIIHEVIKNTNLCDLLGDGNFRMQRKMVLTNMKMVIKRQASSHTVKEKCAFIQSPKAMNHMVRKISS